MGSMVIDEIDNNSDDSLALAWILQKEEYEKDSFNNRNIFNRHNHRTYDRGDNGNNPIIIDDNIDSYLNRQTRRGAGRNNAQIKNDEMVARQIQEELDRELASKLEKEENSRSRHFQNYSSSRNNNAEVDNLNDSNNEDQVSINRPQRSNIYNRNHSFDFGININNNHNYTRYYSSTNPRTRSSNPNLDFMENVNNLFNQRNESIRNNHLHTYMMRSNSRRLLNSDRDFTADDYEALLALDDMNKNKNCLSKSELANLRPFEYTPVTNNTDTDSKTCTICYEDFNIKEKVIALGCFHRFHDNCILEWLKQSRNCPLCKKDAITVK